MESTYIVQDIQTTARHTINSSYSGVCRSKHATEWLAVTSTCADLSEETGKDFSARLDNCRQFAFFVRQRSTGLIRVSSNHCGFRWCPMCASARANAVSVQIQRWLRKASFPKMLTLTLQHTDEPLEDQIRKLYDSFRKLRKIKQFKETVLGGLWFFQVVIDKKSRHWHPHIHCVIEGNFLDNNWLSSEWHRITGDSYIVHVTSIRDFEAASKEIARYASRPNRLVSLSRYHALELVKACIALRTCGTWGTGRACSLRPQVIYDKTDWQKLGSWQTMHKLQNHSDIAQQIISAWMENKPIPENCTMMDSEKFIDDFDDHDGLMIDLEEFQKEYDAW